MPWWIVTPLFFFLQINDTSQTCSTYLSMSSLYHLFLLFLWVRFIYSDFLFFLQTRNNVWIDVMMTPRHSLFIFLLSFFSSLIWEKFFFFSYVMCVRWRWEETCFWVCPITFLRLYCCVFLLFLEPRMFIFPYILLEIRIFFFWNAIFLRAFLYYSKNC